MQKENNIGNMCVFKLIVICSGLGPLLILHDVVCGIIGPARKEKKKKIR